MAGNSFPKRKPAMFRNSPPREKFQTGFLNFVGMFIAIGMLHSLFQSFDQSLSETRLNAKEESWF